MPYVFTVGVSLLSSNGTYLIKATFGRRKKKVVFPRTINERSKVVVFFLTYPKEMFNSIVVRYQNKKMH